jgi:hypothetical protein
LNNILLAVDTFLLGYVIPFTSGTFSDEDLAKADYKRFFNNRDRNEETGEITTTHLFFLTWGITSVYCLMASFIISMSLAIALSFTSSRESKDTFKKMSSFSLILLIISSAVYVLGMVCFFIQFANSILISYPKLCPD